MITEAQAARAAKIAQLPKRKLPKYIYAVPNSYTYKVQIANKYIGGFPTIEAAQACVDEIFSGAQKEKPQSANSEA